MQKGMNQTLAWLTAMVLAAALFGVGLFFVTKYQPHDDDPAEMAAKESSEFPQGEKDADASKEKPDDKKSGEVLRPEH